MKNLLEVMAQLRDPQTGCPWDVEQDFKSIAPYTIEEAYEVADAIERDDMLALKDELGDLLLQVAFHAQMADEAGLFDFADVEAAICEKMVRRHPHVFGGEARGDEQTQLERWEAIKAAERDAATDDGQAVSALDGVTLALPPIQRAEKLGGKASRAGFDWPDWRGVRAKVSEELAEVDEALADWRQRPDAQSQAAVEDELGDILFALVNLGRHTGIDAARALSRANAKFEARFRGMEAAIGEQGLQLKTMQLEALEAAWQAQKKRMAE